MATSNLLKVTQAYFESKKCFVEEVGEDGDVLRAGFTMDNRDALKVYMFFNDERETVKVRAHDITKFSEDKLAKMYKACNDANANYRYVKFFVDESDNTLTADEDLIVDMETCGAEVFRACLNVANIVDEVYPDFQKAIWA